MRVLFLLSILVTSLSFAGTTRVIDADQIDSADKSKTFTLPSSTDTLVGRSTTDTLSNKTINGSSNTITNLDLTSVVTGALPIANGGTGQTTAQTAIDALVPDQTLQNGKFLTTNGTNVSWNDPPSGNLTIISKTSAYTILSTDDIILGDTSGGAFTLTLPAAASNSGKVLTIKYTDSGFLNALTVDGNASETIDGSLTTTLNTRGETLRIVSDGTNWQIVDRRIPSVWVSFTPTGSWTGVTYTGLWKRIGDSAHIQASFTSGASPSGGTLTINIPSGLTIDTSKLTLGTSVFFPLGQTFTGDVSANNLYEAQASYATTTSVYIQTHQAANPQRTATVITTSPFTFTTGDFAGYNIIVPISGWNN